MLKSPLSPVAESNMSLYSLFLGSFGKGSSSPSQPLHRLKEKLIRVFVYLFKMEIIYMSLFYNILLFHIAWVSLGAALFHTGHWRRPYSLCGTFGWPGASHFLTPCGVSQSTSFPPWLDIRCIEPQQVRCDAVSSNNQLLTAYCWATNSFSASGSKLQWLQVQMGQSHAHNICKEWADHRCL